MADNNKITINWGAILGTIAVIVVVIVIIISNIKSNEAKPWWSGVDRLTVTKCNDTYCSNGTSTAQKVLYSGFFSANTDSKEMSSMLSSGLKMLDMKALAAWTIANDDYDVEGQGGAYRFELLSEDQKSKIETWGYCVNKSTKQECIVFSSSAQYRLKP